MPFRSCDQEEDQAQKKKKKKKGRHCHKRLTTNHTEKTCWYNPENKSPEAIEQKTGKGPKEYDPYLEVGKPAKSKGKGKGRIYDLSEQHWELSPEQMVCGLWSVSDNKESVNGGDLLPNRSLAGAASAPAGEGTKGTKGKGPKKGKGKGKKGPREDSTFKPGSIVQLVGLRRRATMGSKPRLCRSIKQDVNTGSG